MQNNKFSIMKELGGEDCLMGLEFIIKLMEIATKDFLRTALSMVKDHNNSQMEIFIKDNMSMVSHKGLVNIFGEMVLHTKEI